MVRKGGDLGVSSGYHRPEGVLPCEIRQPVLIGPEDLPDDYCYKGRVRIRIGIANEMLLGPLMRMLIASISPKNGTPISIWEVLFMIVFYNVRHGVKAL